MAARNTLLKIVTLSGFSLLIIGFVAYKSGVFEPATCKLPAIAAGNRHTDTTLAAPVRDSPAVMMSGSKSLVITQEPEVMHYDMKYADEPAKKPAAKTDTVPIIHIDPENLRMLSSSKSGIVDFDQKIDFNVLKLHLDSLFKDSVKK